MRRQDQHKDDSKFVKRALHKGEFSPGKVEAIERIVGDTPSKQIGGFSKGLIFSMFKEKKNGKTVVLPTKPKTPKEKKKK